MFNMRSDPDFDFDIPSTPVTANTKRRRPTVIEDDDDDDDDDDDRLMNSKAPRTTRAAAGRGTSPKKATILPEVEVLPGKDKLKEGQGRGCGTRLNKDQLLSSFRRS